MGRARAAAFRPGPTAGEQTERGCGGAERQKQAAEPQGVAEACDEQGLPVRHQRPGGGGGPGQLCLRGKRPKLDKGFSRRARFLGSRRRGHRPQPTDSFTHKNKGFGPIFRQTNFSRGKKTLPPARTRQLTRGAGAGLGAPMGVPSYPTVPGDTPFSVVRPARPAGPNRPEPPRPAPSWLRPNRRTQPAAHPATGPRESARRSWSSRCARRRGAG